MSARSPGLAALGALALLVAASTALDAGTPSRRAASPRELPAGEGREVADKACRICHSAMLVTQQAKDSTAWEKTVATMIKWGAPVPPAERDSLLRYLRTAFPARGTK